MPRSSGTLERSHDAAESFNDALREAAGALRLRPQTWPLWPGRTDVRRRLLQGFPFSVVYLEEPAVIFIVAIAHTSRRPGYWLPRLGPPRIR
jgi:toxin ParE1/3/4